MRNVLIVDDEPPIANYIAQVLCANGHNALAICDPAEALEHVKSIRFDVALLGMNMPGMSGVELGIRVREFLPDSTIIVGIEDVLDDSEKVALRSALGFEYLPAPFQVEDLLGKVSPFGPK